MDEKLLVFALISLLLIVVCIFNRNRFDLKHLLDIQTNIIFLASSIKTLYINRAGLEFFNCTDLAEFKSKYNTINNLFIEEDGCINKYTNGKKWLENIYSTKKKRAKVKIKSPIDSMEYYFYIKLSRVKDDSYLLLFTDITSLEKDKDMIRKLADYDALTNIYSRVKFNEILPQYIERALVYNEKLSIILFDIDHFKSINDNYGHNIGDRVLIELSSLIKSLLREMKLRKSTIFSRWGGEEFVILVRFSSKERAFELANILRKEINRYPFDTVKRVTCSFGVTQFEHDDTQIDMFHRVDEALYEAKEQGRNRVILK
jgi:diguanylate cyclase (GGDEF)-like protein